MQGQSEAETRPLNASRLSSASDGGRGGPCARGRTGAALVSSPDGAVFCGRSFTKPQLVISGTATIIILGVILGLVLAPPSEDPPPWNRISAVIGWWYFMAWSVSFFPQLYLNWVRKCVGGQSFDYVALNVLGFSCYSIYAVSFYAVRPVQDDYVERFGNHNNVDLNDVVFAVIATVGVVINTWQIYVYDRAGQQYEKKTLFGIAATVVIFTIWTVLLVVGVRSRRVFNILDFLYGLSVVKLVVSLIKYIPQIYLNYKRQSTIGWNIWNVLLDFSGGLLSVTQQLIDCGTTGRWNGIMGNPIKFALGSLSMIYDLIMIVQHFCLYRENNKLQQAKDAEIRAQLEKEAATEGVFTGCEVLASRKSPLPPDAPLRTASDCSADGTTTALYKSNGTKN